MSNNQLHGKTYEDYIKASFRWSADCARKPSSIWDIENTYDKQYNLPTSIKCTKNNIVCLSDARRFWEISNDYRMLIAIWKQSNDVKIFYKLYEFLICNDEHKRLLNNITKKDIYDFHNNLLEYKFGYHVEARQYAKSVKNKLQQYSDIILNPKIDSQTQRRLQCSIKIDTLLNNIKKYTIYNDGDYYNNIPIFLTIKNTSRIFNKN